MGPYIILICLILGAIGAWSLGGMLSKNDISQKETPKQSELEQKLEVSILKSQERLQQKQEKLKQIRENLARIKAEKKHQKEEEKRRKKEEK